MEANDTAPSSPFALLADAIAHPWRKWGWWALMLAAVSAFFFVLSWGVVSGRILILLIIMAAFVIRCYFSVIESTLTGYGEEAGDGSGLRMDEFWETMGRTFVAALIAWGPVAVGAIVLSQQGLPLHPWISLLGAFGCEYFPMALLGIVNFGGLHGAMPQHVFPAIFRCGTAYALAGLGLLLVPYSFHWTLLAIPAEGFWPIVAATAVASFFMIAHARLIARIYLANQQRIGW